MKWACGIDFELEGIYFFSRCVAVDEIGLENIPNDIFFFFFELIVWVLRVGYSLMVCFMRVRLRQYGQSKVAGSRRILRIWQEIMDFRC